MPACESCGTDRAADRVCSRCGHPVLSGEASRLAGEAADLTAIGQRDLAIRKIQQAIKLDESAWFPRLKLAFLYGEKAALGEAALERLAEREFREAMRLGPLERDVHAARIERAARRGGLAILRAEYSEKKGEIPVFGEFLGMIEAMESAAKLGGQTEEKVPPPAENYRAKMFLVAGLLTAVCTFGMVIKMIVKNQSDFDYVFVGGGDFWASLVFLTATMVLGLEFLRASGKLKKK